MRLHQKIVLGFLSAAFVFAAKSPASAVIACPQLPSMPPPEPGSIRKVFPVPTSITPLILGQTVKFQQYTGTDYTNLQQSNEAFITGSDINMPFGAAFTHYYSLTINSPTFVEVNPHDLISACGNCSVPDGEGSQRMATQLSLLNESGEVLESTGGVFLTSDTSTDATDFAYCLNPGNYVVMAAVATNGQYLNNGADNNGLVMSFELDSGTPPVASNVDLNLTFNITGRPVGAGSNDIQMELIGTSCKQAVPIGQVTSLNCSVPPYTSYDLQSFDGQTITDLGNVSSGGANTKLLITCDWGNGDPVPGRNCFFSNQ